ncbi:MAG: anthranilate phosphoribosyltransferase, partial [Gammaproteobacteria bacterium]
AESIEQGLEKARAAIADGAARRKLEDLVKLTNEFK